MTSEDTSCSGGLFAILVKEKGSGISKGKQVIRRKTKCGKFLLGNPGTMRQREESSEQIFA